MLTKQDIDAVRGLVNRVGAPEAARILGVHRTSLLALLSGVGVRPNTDAVIAAAIKSGAIEHSDVVRGETKAHSDRTKRGAR